MRETIFHFVALSKLLTGGVFAARASLASASAAAAATDEAPPSHRHRGGGGGAEEEEKASPSSAASGRRRELQENYDYYNNYYGNNNNANGNANNGGYYYNAYENYEEYVRAQVRTAGNTHIALVDLLDAFSRGGFTRLFVSSPCLALPFLLCSVFAARFVFVSLAKIITI